MTIENNINNVCSSYNYIECPFLCVMPFHFLYKYLSIVQSESIVSHRHVQCFGSLCLGFGCNVTNFASRSRAELVLMVLTHVKTFVYHPTTTKYIR